ncbi:psb27 [Symbiodinium sp. CCMP2592]|nr:psb27 [Symbiodinium sp. CCMP2592]
MLILNDYKTFYMKSKYRQDTYQVMKHMKISASLDKGTPNMEKWNSRVKKEMNDWLALYRRQNLSVGRQSYYSLYSAINTLASHFTSYGDLAASFPMVALSFSAKILQLSAAFVRCSQRTSAWACIPKLRNLP